VGEVVVVGVADGLRTVVCAGFAEQVVDVGFDGGLGDVEPRRDLGVGQAGGDQGEDLGLPGGQPVRQRRGCER
jgi:hypothetical protein